MKIPIFLLCLFLFSCQAQNNETRSENKYAYAAPAKNAGILYNLYLFSLSESLSFQKTLPVCVERTGNERFDRRVFIEVQLAYYKWFASVSNFSEEVWEVFHFYLSETCDFKKIEFASKILILNDLHTASASYENDFKMTEAECEKTELIQCKSSSASVGLGSGAELKYSFVPSEPNYWTKISITSPAKVVLSPFVNWVPLDKAVESIIQNLKDSSGEDSEKISDSLNFLQLYNNASASPNLSFEQIESLSDSLDNLNLIYNLADPELEKILAEFKNKDGTKIKKKFKLTVPSFSILLHEVGHQFGMSHADQPRTDAITGQSEFAQFDEGRQQWICKESIMAYGKNFLYLTDDDKRGAESLFLASREFVKGVTEN